MICDTRTVNVPAQAEIDADLAEYGHVGRACQNQYGEAAVEAGAPDFPDGPPDEAQQTGAVDAIANVLLWLAEEGGDPDAALRSASDHFDAERER
jgi:hypothetical protein